MVKKVDVRVVEQEGIITPAEAAWDSFFLGEQSATEDFMSERGRPAASRLKQR